MSDRKIGWVAVGIALAWAAGAAAEGERVTVYHEELAEMNPYEIVDARFQAGDDEAGSDRAWIEVTRRKDFGDERREIATTSRNVPGLSYDAASGEIRYKAPDGKEVACAEVKRKGFLFFHWRSIDETGRCVMSGRLVDTNVDDGFRVRERPFAEVVLSVDPAEKERSSSAAERFPASTRVVGRITRERER